MEEELYKLRHEGNPVQEDAYWEISNVHFKSIY
jgi:hypothetical protein